MNFKSHNIFNESSRDTLFKIIKITNPQYICLTEALVPTAIADAAKSGRVIQDLSNFSDKDIVSQPYNACRKFTEKKKTEHEMEDKKPPLQSNISIKDGIKTLTNQWVRTFIGLGYKHIIFGNPIHCPYGTNWGNCIITKEQPDFAHIEYMTPIKVHKASEYADDGFQESRCMIHIKKGDHNILCTHLEDKASGTRKEQTREIITYIGAKVTDCSKITVVGDLNAINGESYTFFEKQLLRKLNNGSLPMDDDAVELLNAALKRLEITKPLNTGQKYESLYQKCVSHAYSNFYKESLLIFTDATNFDHQPLLLVKPITGKETEKETEKEKGSEP